jgi:hypothetical protein
MNISSNQNSLDSRNIVVLSSDHDDLKEKLVTVLEEMKCPYKCLCHEQYSNPQRPPGSDTLPSSFEHRKKNLRQQEGATWHDTRRKSSFA